MDDILGSNSGNSATKLVFIGHHLTPYFAKLLAVSRVAVTGGRLKPSWITSNGDAVRFKDDTLKDSINTIRQLLCVLAML